MFNINEFFNTLLLRGSASGMTEVEFLEAEINHWLASERYWWMNTGNQYYTQHMDIDDKKRTMLDNGHVVEVKGIPNHKLGYNRYAKLVNQKVNYLLARPVEVKTEDDGYRKKLNKVFDSVFRRRLKNIGVDAMNNGIAYLHPYISGGQLKFKRFPATQILPFWADDDHEELEAFLRMYGVVVYKGKTPTIVHKVEYYTTKGVTYYEWKNGHLIPDVARSNSSYLTIEGKPMNWERVPLVAFKYNAQEIPLIKRVKSLQDALNTLLSNFADVMCEDIRNTILVIKNYDGTDLSEFRRNLATYGAVKVRTRDGIMGDVEALTIEVNAQNYEAIIKFLKKAIIDAGQGFDADDDRLGNNPNQMNINSIYSNIDMDANNMEMEFQASLQQLMWFVDTYLKINGTETDAVEFIFNRETPVNESEVIANCRNSVGILSTETIVSMHPWTKDTAEELKRLRAEQAEALGGDYVENNK